MPRYVGARIRRRWPPAAGTLPIPVQSLRTSVSVLVVDEADLVLSYGGGADIKARVAWGLGAGWHGVTLRVPPPPLCPQAVVAALPRITHTLLVSATLSTKVRGWGCGGL